MSHSATATANTTHIGADARQDAAGDAFNGINEGLWQHIREQIGHVPSFNECVEFTGQMPADVLALYL